MTRHPRGRRREMPALGWALGGQLYAKGANTAAYLVMLLFLTPAEVGLVALCWITVVVGEAFFDLGLSQYYVREGRRDVRAESTMLWATLALAGVWTTLSFAVAPPLAGAFDTPELERCLIALAALYPLRALSWVPLSIQIVERRQDLVALREVVSTSAGAALGIGLAAGGAGPWSLIGRTLATAAVATAFTWLVTPWRPCKACDIGWLRRALRFGVPLTIASNLHWVVLMQLEGVLIGSRLGLEALGVVQFARKPGDVLSQVMTALQRSYLARELGGAIATRAGFVRTQRRAAVRFVAFGSVIAVLAHGFGTFVVGPVWGGRWDEAVPLITIYAIGLPAIGMLSVASAALVALGRLRLLLAANIAGVAFAGAAIALGVQGGLASLAVMQTAALAGLTALMAVLVHRAASAADA